jgi:CheY-like chemotaxis protein
MTKRLVELMGGVIGLESTVGQGSTFWFEMDLTHTRVQEASAVNDQPIKTYRQTGAAQHLLLYVEDNPANLMLVEDLIARRSDIKLITARDGLEGVALARSAVPDMILMDINLPGISGITALLILAKDPATKHIPIVALSANAMPRDIAKGLDAGFFRYLTKPIKVNEFMDTLDLTLKYVDAHPAPLAQAERAL